ncbi:ATP-dependent endonuclease [Accumulibacter sp.]|uniref:ATP-dependent nuclease n=1 Tax=Accumulibacter sp. TaxID=2053492 RepID=UPI0035AFB633
MKITGISIKNFRLLEDVSLCLEEGVTVIVGRNNSGKTSLTELFRRVLDEKSSPFQMADFSLGIHEQFWDTYLLYAEGSNETDIRQSLPSISITLHVDYKNDESLGPLSEFVVDLNEECTFAKINIQHTLAAGRIDDFFEGLDGTDRGNFFQVIKERIPHLFATRIEAEDPNDPTNTKPLETKLLRALLQVGFINAQRALDDASYKEKAVLGKVFERLFTSATSRTANEGDQVTANALKSAVSEIQNHIDQNFNEQLQKLIPTLDLFGYPGLGDPQLRTETILDVEKLLSNHTTVGYLGENGVNLPESYNGLGPRNLIFILLKLFEFFKEFASRQPSSGVHLIFIEEPEAHLHPQMQSVFIRKLDEIRQFFVTRYANGDAWPVQFIVTTHSSHIANEATFDSMRYFLARQRNLGSLIWKTEVKDLRTGLSNEPHQNREFLHKYMTLTRCDLLFADKAIVVEGTTERMLLPEMIQKFDLNLPKNTTRLRSKYLSIMEVGGAYAHCFFNLLDFLNLQTLIITDLDTVHLVPKTTTAGKTTNKRESCLVSEGQETSNACINTWFNGPAKEKLSPVDLLAKSVQEKTTDNRRLAFQVPQVEGDACGRSLEGAFILANPEKFGLSGLSTQEREREVWNMAKKEDKADFAMKYSIVDTDWTTPRYIEEGLQWLAGSSSSTPEALDSPADLTVEQNVNV